MDEQSDCNEQDPPSSDDWLAIHSSLSSRISKFSNSKYLQRYKTLYSSYEAQGSGKVDRRLLFGARCGRRSFVPLPLPHHIQALTKTYDTRTSSNKSNPMFNYSDIEKESIERSDIMRMYEEEWAWLGFDLQQREIGVASLAEDMVGDRQSSVICRCLHQRHYGCLVVMIGVCYEGNPWQCTFGVSTYTSNAVHIKCRYLVTPILGIIPNRNSPSHRLSVSIGSYVSATLKAVDTNTHTIVLTMTDADTTASADGVLPQPPTFHNISKLFSEFIKSFNETLFDGHREMSLGSVDVAPLSSRRSLLNRVLNEDPLFRNPLAIRNCLYPCTHTAQQADIVHTLHSGPFTGSYLKFIDRATLLHSLSVEESPNSENYLYLRYQQNLIWANSLVTRARAAASEGAHLECIKFCSEALSIDSQHLDALVLRAMTYVSVDKLASALSDMANAVVKMPTNDIILRQWSHLLSLLSESERQKWQHKITSSLNQSSIELNQNIINLAESSTSSLHYKPSEDRVEAAPAHTLPLTLDALPNNLCSIDLDKVDLMKLKDLLEKDLKKDKLKDRNHKRRSSRVSSRSSRDSSRSSSSSGERRHRRKHKRHRRQKRVYYSDDSNAEKYSKTSKKRKSRRSRSRSND